MHVKFKDGCPLPTVDILWSTYAYPVARLWSQFYLSKMQNFSILTSQDPTYVYLREDWCTYIILCVFDECDVFS